MEHKCLPEVREKCLDCDGPECSYSPGSRCEEDNLAYLAPDVRQELEAYRATKLTPEEVAVVREMFDGDPYVTISRARDLVEADRDGRCVILPCKVGDVVYHCLEECDSPERLCDMDCAACGHFKKDILEKEIESEAEACAMLAGWGTTVFPTRQAAEEASEDE